MKHIIKNGSAYFLEGSYTHNAWTFESEEAARFTEFGAELRKLQINNWRGEELEVIEMK